MKKETREFVKQIITPEVAEQLLKIDFNDILSKFVNSIGYTKEDDFDSDLDLSEDWDAFEENEDFLIDSEYEDSFDLDFVENDENFLVDLEDEPKTIDLEDETKQFKKKKIARKKYKEATEEEMELDFELKPIYSEPFKGFNNGLLYLKNEDEAYEYEIDCSDELTETEDEGDSSEFEKLLRSNWTPDMYELNMLYLTDMNSERRQAAIHSLSIMYKSIYSLRETYLAYYGKRLSKADIYNMARKSIENGFRFLGANSLLFSIYKESNDFRKNSGYSLIDSVKLDVLEREKYFASADWFDFIQFEDTKFFKDNSKRLLLEKALRALKNKLNLENISAIKDEYGGYKEIKDVQELMHEIMKQDEHFLFQFSPDYEIKHNMGLAVDIELPLISSKGIEMVDDLFETCGDIDYHDTSCLDLLDASKYELESRIELAQRLLFISRTLENSLLTLGQLEKGSGFLINPIAKTERMAHRIKVQEFILDFLKKELKKLKKYMKRYNEEFGKTFMIESINEINTRLRGCDASTNILANLMIVNQAILELMLEHGYNYQSWRFVSRKAIQ